MPEPLDESLALLRAQTAELSLPSDFATALSRRVLFALKEGTLLQITAQGVFMAVVVTLVCVLMSHERVSIEESTRRDDVVESAL